MSFADTVSDDFKITDSVESVVYTAIRANGNTSFAVPYADGHDYTLKEVAASQGLLGSGERLWVLGGKLFPDGVRPQAGDKIEQSDGTVWILVNDATLDSFRISWFCQTRRKQ